LSPIKTGVNRLVFGSFQRKSGRVRSVKQGYAHLTVLRPPSGRTIENWNNRVAPGRNMSRLGQNPNKLFQGLESFKAFTSKSPWHSYRNRVSISTVHCSSPPRVQVPPPCGVILQNKRGRLGLPPQGEWFQNNVRSLPGGVQGTNGSLWVIYASFRLRSFCCFEVKVCSRRNEANRGFFVNNRITYQEGDYSLIADDWGWVPSR